MGENKNDDWTVKKTALCKSMLNYMDNFPGKNASNYKWIEVRELLGFLETFFANTTDLKMDGDARTLKLMEKTLQLLQTHARGNKEETETPGATLKVRLQREFYDAQEEYFTKAGLVSGIALPAGAWLARRQTSFYANVRHYNGTTRTHNWERAHCTLDPVKKTMQYTTASLSSQHIDVKEIKELKTTTRPTHGGVDLKQQFAIAAAGMIVKDAGKNEYHFGVCKGKPEQNWSSGWGAFKRAGNEDKDKRNDILKTFGVVPAAAAARRRLAQNVDSTPNRRRMAQREFSNRVDSPVMIRLLKEIVAAQD